MHYKNVSCSAVLTHGHDGPHANLGMLCMTYLKILSLLEVPIQ